MHSISLRAVIGRRMPVWSKIQNGKFHPVPIQRSASQELHITKDLMFLVARENLVFNDDHLPAAVFNADVDPASRVFSLLANVSFTGSPCVGRVK